MSPRSETGVMEVVEATLRGAGATEAFGARVARAVKPPLIILLEGDLGMGKTTFARGFVRALPGGARVTVQSPTFALARSYPTQPVVHHLDLYRLEQGSLAGGHGLEALGLLDMLEDPDALSLVEWPRGLTVPGVLCARLRFNSSGTWRRVELTVPAAAVLSAAALHPGHDDARRGG